MAVAHYLDALAWQRDVVKIFRMLSQLSQKGYLHCFQKEDCSAICPMKL
jgi:hypothetical protein